MGYFAATHLYTQNDPDGAARKFCFFLVDSVDKYTAEEGEAGGQPLIRKPGETSFINTSDTLTHIASGHYIITLTIVEIETVGVFSIFYENAGVYMFQGTGVVVPAETPEAAAARDITTTRLVKLQQQVDWIEVFLRKTEKSRLLEKDIDLT